jgi:hypothetical protein
LKRMPKRITKTGIPTVSASCIASTSHGGL